MLKITRYNGGVHNVKDGDVLTFASFAELALYPSWSNCPKVRHGTDDDKAKKGSDYFIRGHCVPKKDTNIAESSILVLDVDKDVDGGVAPTPQSIHNLLTSLDIAHILYTSYSHSPPGFQKCRVLIPTDRPMVKDDLRPTMEDLFHTLDKMGLRIHRGGENFSWAQAWFFPKSKSPDVFYHAIHLGAPFPAAVEPAATSAGGGGGGGGGGGSPGPAGPSSRSDSDIIQAILSGKDYHNSLLSLSYTLLKDGLLPKRTERLCKAIMEACQERREPAWTKDYEDIPRMVRGGASRASEPVFMEMPDNDERPYTKQMPIPSGMFSELVENCYNMARYQYEEIAIVSALGLLASMCGRHYNIEGTGLNIYMTLIANTGIGKDFIRQWINRCLQDVAPLGFDSSSFQKMTRATGPAGMSEALLKARSQLAIFTEAGLLLKSTAGDQDGLTRYILTAYSASGSRECTGEEYYSGGKNIPSIRAAALSVINEATPITLLEAFSRRNSGETGEIPRQSVFRITKDRPHINRNAKVMELSPHVKEKLKLIMNECSKVQTTNDPEAIDVLFHPTIQDDVWAYNDQLTDLSNGSYRENPMLANMATRSWMKAAKMAALASVFNHDIPVIMKPEWEWAKAMTDYELDSVSTLFANGGASDPFGMAIHQYVYPVIKKIIGRGYEKLQTTRTESDKYIFRAVDLKQKLQSKAEILKNAIPTKYARDGDYAAQILLYLIKSGLIYKVDEFRPERYQISQEFIATYCGQ